MAIIRKVSKACIYIYELKHINILTVNVNVKGVIFTESGVGKASWTQPETIFHSPTGAQSH